MKYKKWYIFCKKMKILKGSVIIAYNNFFLQHYGGKELVFIF